MKPSRRIKSSLQYCTKETFIFIKVMKGKRYSTNLCRASHMKRWCLSAILTLHMITKVLYILRHVCILYLSPPWPFTDIRHLIAQIYLSLVRKSEKSCLCIARDNVKAMITTTLLKTIGNGKTLGNGNPLVVHNIWNTWPGCWKIQRNFPDDLHGAAGQLWGQGSDYAF